MSNREKAIVAMAAAVSSEHKCQETDVEFVDGLQLGTTWEGGSDFYADYEISTTDETGRVYWDYPSQEAYF